MVREAKLKDAQAIQNLICFYSEDGKMLFRTFEEIEQCIADFIVFEKNNEIVLTLYHSRALYLLEHIKVSEWHELPLVNN